MSRKFQALVHGGDGVDFVKLTGVIDEDSELAGLTDCISGPTVVVGLGEIERINSSGVRDWVTWLESVEKKGCDVVLVECSPAIVAQINLVSNFTGSGSVKSFYVPYFCSSCDEEKVLLCESTDVKPPLHQPPVCRCDGCDLVMDFDDMPESYFAFLSNVEKITVSAIALSGLNQFSLSTDRTSRIVPRVGDSIIYKSNPSIALAALQSSPLVLPAAPGNSSNTGSPGGAGVSTHQGRLPTTEVSGIPRLGASRKSSRSLDYVLASIFVVCVGTLLYLLSG